ncbi:alpha/beta hydrolase [Terriglobus saanensis]|uniref:Serine aminopeptidase S33 domain-containing protein n=1 Tax=Terriglobus saanensis (strain ATCC BAA-1853 / DSM 23119 / SP1PR4) TaxID=401053 RepID=E8V798_TERSS|nr:alpha/beta hydrolase [Terriglobus saanensis]ADV82811.1 hypothetical protein AciPR4_2007 [Terriglobus saanensis SP1PR4]
MAKEDRSRVKEGAGAAPELIDPLWLLKMVGIVIGLALVCGYLTMAGLFWQGAWQLVLHPVRNTAQLQIPGIKTEEIRFAADEAGRPQLQGWWLSSSPVSAYAVLYLRGGESSLAINDEDKRNLLRLHAAGLGVFAFDYRGYGDSAILKPSEEHMQQDAAAAFDFLTQQRGFLPDHVLLFGTGIGASLAATSSLIHTSVAGLILDQPDTTLLRRVQEDGRARVLPVSLLFRDRFEVAAPLHRSLPPKLLITTEATQGNAQTANDKATHAAFDTAASPKNIVIMMPGAGLQAQKDEALRRFLDTYVPSARSSPLLR